MGNAFYTLATVFGESCLKGQSPFKHLSSPSPWKGEGDTGGEVTIMDKRQIVIGILLITALLLLGACTPAPPSPGSGVSPLTTSQIIFEGSALLKAGETKSLRVLLSTKEDFGPGPHEVSYKLFRVARGYGQDEIPMPEGLEVSIEPARFMAYPNAQYHSTITIKTTPELSPGEYCFRFESECEGSPMWTGGWITVIVE